MNPTPMEQEALDLMDEAISEAKWAVRYLILHMVCLGTCVWIIFSNRPFWAAMTLGIMSFVCSLYSGKMMAHSKELRDEADRIFYQ